MVDREHTEQEAETQELNLQDLKPGDEVMITTGKGDEAWTYTFRTNEVPRNAWPIGTLRAIRPDGSETEEIDFELFGSGVWTTRSQNPVQTAGHGFTAPHDRISKGGFMYGWFHKDGHRIDERAIFDKPGQEISAIQRN